ncbi:patatin-like phospholipase family protein [Burkholderia ubonensis]|uniref:patatin-like phospholipase family protein n=1 Tax=Burkholderia ubonensis TaxID=101571 RepID=UPI000BA76073|nr:patatin [Burkholderia ubonensis]RQP40767.1 patatin-like phospholipase family protein [Burkholderia ubonensis]RQP40996.1 patatin-like phospholipase family protein [Burkholderia ubonensis]RQP44180.1 patatin-like phospholipase family protein [Burkholderia ubonensis]RQP54690.1 patatin-like phospholipase family protein [Burkholderia ubonensis]
MFVSQPERMELPGQVVLVLQGGGALGAYQLGVFQAMSESGIEPDWVIGTSIGAINAALIVGNPPERRDQRLAEFWRRVTERTELAGPVSLPGWDKLFAEMMIIGGGITGFFEPNPASWLGPMARLGVDRASYYRIAPLRDTLISLIEPDLLNAGRPRLTVGAVNACTGEMRYFDSRDHHNPLTVEHIMSSGALPPAFPAVRIDGQPYWDGGVYSNTPVEVVLDDTPRRSSIIFSVQMWNPVGPEPESIWQVSERQKDIQYASRTDSQIKRQQQIHRLRHVIRELVRHVPEAERATPEVRALAAWGCQTTMRVIKLAAPRLNGDNQFKDIDFTPAGIAARRRAGYDAAMRAIAARPWEVPMDPIEGLSVYSPDEAATSEARV